jgi:predicted ArsR family transcriptional regulator
MDQSTQRKILEYLRSAPPQTAAELAHHFSLTSADVRYHLARLLDAGSVLRVSKRKGSGAGRPGSAYTSRPLGSNQGVSLLTEAFLQLIPPADEETIALQLAQNISNRQAPQECTGHSLQLGVDHLTRLGYSAVWEARPKNPLLKLRCCPYQQLAEKHPVLCQVDRHLIYQLTGWHAEPKTLIRTDLEKIPACIFSLNQP